MSKEVYECEDQMVSHPNHYQSENGIEVIDVIDAFVEDPESVYVGNVLKYVCRYKKKNGLQDLRKAAWYLDRLIKHLEENSKVIKSAEPVDTIRDDKGRLLDKYKPHTPEFVFDNIFAAREFENNFIEQFEFFGMVRVSDVLDLMGMTDKPGDNDYGWISKPDILVTEDAVTKEVIIKFSPDAGPLTIKHLEEKESN